MTTTHFIRGNIKDENLGVNLQKKDGLNGKGKNLLLTGKKGGGGGGFGVGSRKALNDITNKSVKREEVTTKRNNLTVEEVSEKHGFLHDHKKCIEVHRKEGVPYFDDIVLPGTDVKVHDDHSNNSHQLQAVLESPRCYPEPDEMPEINWDDYEKKGNSPSISTLDSPDPVKNCDSPTTFALDLALKDNTVKPVPREQVSTEENNVVKDFNIKDERFLHDHKKCIEAQNSVGVPFVYDIVFPGTDLKLCDDHFNKSHQSEMDPVSPRCYPEPVEMPEFDWEGSEKKEASPPTSPLSWGSSPSPLFTWLPELVEFTLKPEIEV